MKENQACRRIGLAMADVIGILSAAFMVVPPSLAQQPVTRIEVTGSSIKRIDGESALPVQIISREQIEATGAVSAEQFLQSVGVALMGNSNTVAATAAGQVSGNVSGVSLRGLGSQRTLVLIDGKRVSAGGTITDSTTVDVNLIPTSAIERIEILKDGASAIYGSDAIGGVINFIMRKDYNAGEVTVYGGRSSQDGGRVDRANMLIGWGDFAKQRFNLTLTANYQKEGSVMGSQRDFAKNGIFPNANNDVTSGNTFPANILVTTTGDTLNPSAPGCPKPYAVSDPAFFPTARCRFDPSPLVSLLPEIEVKSFMANGRLALTDNVEAYSQLSYVNKESRTIIQPVPLSDQFGIPAQNPLASQAPYFDPGSGFAFSTFLLKNTSAYYPAALVATVDPTLPDLLVRYRSAATGNRDTTNIADSWRAVLGSKGELGRGWDFDAAYLHTETKLTEQVNGGFPLLSKIMPLLNSGTVNPFGPSTPDVQAQIDATQFHGDAYWTKSTIDSVAGKVTKDLTKLAGGPLALALGAEGRRESFTTNPSPELQAGDISGYGGNFLPVDKSRNVSAAFFEISAPFARGFEATLAARYDNYQGSDSKVSPKAALRWQPIKETLFRASIGDGFRAPNLTELYSPQTLGVSAPGLNDPKRCAITGSSNDCGTQFPITLGGSSSLKSETSTNKSLGFLYEPTNNVSLGFDWFHVDLKDTIVFGVQPAAILADQVKYASFITRGTCSAADLAAFAAVGLPCVGPITNINQVNQNLGETKVQGLDVDWKWRIPAKEWGNFTLALNGTHLTHYSIQNPDGTFSSINGMVNPIVNGAGGVIPKWRHYAYLDWKRGPWNVTLAQQYQSSYHDMCGTADGATGSGDCPPFTHEKVDRYQVFHLTGSYTGLFDKNLKVNFGVRNIEDKAPPYTNAGGQNYFQAGYDPGYVDPRGRFFYTQLTYKFK